MNTTEINNPPPRKPLRVWPGAVAVVAQWLLLVGLPLVAPGAAPFGLLGGVGAGLAVLTWWLFFSRAPWAERAGAIVLMVIGVLATKRVVDVSISNGMMGMMLPVYSIPVMSLALVAAAAAGRRWSAGRRRAAIAAAIVIACAAFTLVRTDGITGDAQAQLHWRWTPTAEERLLARSNPEPLETPAPQLPAPEPAARPADSTAPDRPAVRQPGAAPVEGPAPSDPRRTGVERPAMSEPTIARVEWPGFRGPARDGVVRGVRIETDWTGKPPAELWRRQIGPGWSSFAVHGKLFYTQEQRGEHEVVSAYTLASGEPVWRHRDAVRFYESNGGAGPRATPAVSNGRVYTLGATGIVNALDAANGAVVWARNAKTDTGAPTPGWGFAGSPLVVADAVIVAASGRLVSYDAAAGKLRWVRETGGGGYSSPHLATIDGVPQILLLSGGGGVTSVAPADGTVLWQHSWMDGVAIVQPSVVSGTEVVTSGGDMMGGVGMRRIAVTHGAGAWSVEERWTSRGLKPYFNDFVVHKGHAYGFDGTILSCINLQDGERRWKGGRYGAGQMVLLPEQDLLLVLSEEGELVLVAAKPEKHTEVARFKAIEGKTWNHPVLVRDVLLVRNGEEMAAFRLSVTNP